MKIRVLGAGAYGAHLALSLIRDGHEVELHETASRIFSGASGAIPARLHQGQHYPRSKLTRDACKEHYKEFMSVYGHLTRGVPINLYCIAEYDSLIDFGTYCQILKDSIDYVISDPLDHGLINVEGAVLTGERHIIVDWMRDWFAKELDGVVKFNAPSGFVEDLSFDYTIDATFCAHDSQGIERFEVCLTVLLNGPVDKAVTIMDGEYPSMYPWKEEENLCSLTSAKWTPIYRRATWKDAKRALDDIPKEQIEFSTREMINQMAEFYPAIREYKVADHRLAIRAMPRSGSDARLVDIVRISDKVLRVRAGKLDAVFHAERLIKEMISNG